MRMYVGLDTATTTGVACWIPERQEAYVFEVKGEPVQQLRTILHQLDWPKQELVFVMEKLHTFQNAHTTRSLLERYGYIKHTLKGGGFRVEEVSPKMARHHLLLASKGEVFDHFGQFFEGNNLSTHQTDALAVAIYRACLEEFVVWEDQLTILEKELHNVKDRPRENSAR